jgi:signal transduction histidine kinase
VRPIRLQVERTSIADVLRSAVALAERKVPRRDVAISLDVSDSLPLIQADQHQLGQLFTNLLINAFEALDGHGNVAITAREGVMDEDVGAGAEPHPPTQTLVIDVADDGPGVPHELTDRIFNAFFTTKPQGSGLGLAIVRKIVDAHDGRIDIVSGTGRGTRFRITLPVSGGNEWFQ